MSRQLRFAILVQLLILSSSVLVLILVYECTLYTIESLVNPLLSSSPLLPSPLSCGLHADAGGRPKETGPRGLELHVNQAAADHSALYSFCRCGAP